MNDVQRKLLIERDGRECQSCHGTCPYRSDGLKCRLLAKTLPAATYWRLDNLVKDQPWLRLQVDHLDGKNHEEWNRCWSLCDCCHKKKVEGGGEVYEAGVAYLATVGPEPEEYRVAREQEASDKSRRRAKKKAAGKAYRKTQKAKVVARPKRMAKPPPTKREQRNVERAALPFPMSYSKKATKDIEQSLRKNWNSFTS